MRAVLDGTAWPQPLEERSMTGSHPNIGNLMTLRFRIDNHVTVVEQADQACGGFADAEPVSLGRPE